MPISKTPLQNIKTKRIAISDLIFSLIIFLLVLLSVLSYKRIIDLDKKSEAVTHSNLVQLKLEQVLSNVKDAESGQRGFLLSNDPKHLQQYFESTGLQQKTLLTLDSLTKDNSSQQRNLQLLEWLVKRRLFRLQWVVDSARLTPQNYPLLLNEGKIIMDQLRNVTSQMMDEENKLLLERTQEKIYTSYITPRYSLMLSVLAILTVSIAYFILRTQTRLRFTAEDTSKKLTDYFNDLPAAFSILKGPDHIHEITNDLYNQITGKSDLIGKSFREGIPELKEQSLHEEMDKVYKTGNHFIGRELPILFNRGGNKKVPGFYNFVFQPILNQSKKVEGILIFGYEITEMMEARRIAEETELRSRLAIEAANIGTFDWDLENKKFNSSDRLVEIFGYDSSQEVIHQNLVDTFHPDDKDIRNKAVDDSFAKGSLSYEARIIRPDQSIRWISVYGKNIHNNTKEVVRMYGTVLDITDQRNILEALKRSEAQFRLLADSMPQFVWTSDVDGNLNYVSKALLEYTRLPLEFFLGKGWINIVHPDEKKATEKKWMDSITSGEEFIFEHRMRNHAEEYRWHLSRAIPQMGPDGRIQRWVGTSADIQEQKNLLQQQELLIKIRTKELVDLNQELLIKNNIFAEAEMNAMIGSYSWNLHTGELEYSDNLFRLFGYEPNEFIPSFEKFNSLIHPEDKEQVMKDGLETMATKKLVEHTYRIISKDAKIKYFRSTGKFMGTGENTILIGTVQDISQDKSFNEILQAKNLELERSNAELESFNYIASHDLQEPLRKIQAFSERILTKEANNFSTFSQDYFRRINAAAARMQNLIDALLSYSKANPSNLSDKPTDLNVLLSEVLEDLQERILDKNASVNFSQLPTLKIVRTQLHQLFINLVSNALKYSKTGFVPEINITANIISGKDISDPNAVVNLNYWQLSIADNGIGFEQQYEKKIFELFQRLHGTSDYIGTGIGLAICKKIMRNHQGFISAIGIPGTGATFNIYFPIL